MRDRDAREARELEAAGLTEHYEGVAFEDHMRKRGRHN